MMSFLALVSGTLILIITIYDFVFTTLSGGGSGFISRYVHLLSHKILKTGARIVGRKLYNQSGIFLNGLLISVWVVLIWLGLFLIYSFQPEAIVNDDGQAASNIERFYFTGYTLSTLGIGNFKPVSTSFELLTSIFSFFGFIFFTTSITYLVSVFSSLNHKRALALSIHNLGKTPEEMVYRLLNQNGTFSRINLLSIQDKIERHLVNLQAFPVLHSYANSKVQTSLNLNLVVLDEALSILLNSKEGAKIKNALGSIRTSITHLLNHIEENLPNSSTHLDTPDVHKLKGWEIISSSFLVDPALLKRRNILSGLLERENFVWNDVYQLDQLF